MKTVSRNGLFETNSSSTHSLVLVKNDFAMSGDLDFKDGVLTIRCDDFSKAQTVSGQKRKLEYVATMIYIANKFTGLYGLDRVSTDDDESPWMLNDVFWILNRHFPQIKSVVIEDFGKAGMDPEYARFDSSIVDITDEHSLMEFVFGDCTAVEIFGK